MLTLEIMQKLWVNGDQHVPGLLEGIAGTSAAVFEEYKVTSPLAVALMMAQFSEECGAGLEMTENLNYSAQGLLRTWPRHFTGTMAVKFAHNPRMIADIAYGGRMGNAPPPSDDGWNYRGRGLSQTTGKDAYEQLMKVTEIDVITNPGLLSDPQYTLKLGVADFVELCGCLPFAEKGDVLNTTKHLNGGTNGLAERQRWTVLWRQQLGV
jgi:putative chitinase